MKFCYCPECRSMQTMNWYTRERCERCGGKCVVVKVDRTVVGWLVYLFSALALASLVLYAGHYVLGVPAFDFVGSVAADLMIALIFVSIAIALVCQFVELGRESAIAMSRVGRKGDSGETRRRS